MSESTKKMRPSESEEYKGPSVKHRLFAHDWADIQRHQCTPYKGGYARFEYRSDIPDSISTLQFILPFDNKNTLSQGPYLFVLGVTVDGDVPILGLSYINPHEFGNSHPILTEYMARRIGREFYVIFAGELVLHETHVDFVDKSGHYLKFLKKELETYHGTYYNQLPWDVFLKVVFGPYFEKMLGVQSNVPHQLTLDYSIPMFDLDAPDLMHKFRTRVCSTSTDYDMYFSESDCERHRSKIGTFCSNDQDLSEAVSMARRQHEEKTRHIFSDIEKLRANQIVSRDDPSFHRLLEYTGIKFGPGTLGTYLSVLKRKLL